MKAALDMLHFAIPGYAALCHLSTLKLTQKKTLVRELLLSCLRLHVFIVFYVNV